MEYKRILSFLVTIFCLVSLTPLPVSAQGLAASVQEDFNDAAVDSAFSEPMIPAGVTLAGGLTTMVNGKEYTDRGQFYRIQQPTQTEATLGKSNFDWKFNFGPREGTAFEVSFDMLVSGGGFEIYLLDGTGSGQSVKFKMDPSQYQAIGASPATIKPKNGSWYTYRLAVDNTESALAANRKKTPAANWNGAPKIDLTISDMNGKAIYSSRNIGCYRATGYNAESPILNSAISALAFRPMRAKDSVDFYIDNLTFQEYTEEYFLRQEISEISFDEIKGVNLSADKVDSDLNLWDGRNTRMGYADVAWTSSRPSVIEVNGEVNCMQTEQKVTLTATFTYQAYPELVVTKTFEVTVLADTDDVSAVAAAKESLTLGDTSAVKKDLALPLSGRKDTTIIWETSNAGVITKEGKITRPYGDDKSAVLTATIVRGTATATKTFPVTVAGIVPMTIESVSFQTAEGEAAFSPVDGGRVTGVTFTSGIADQDVTGSETVIVGIYQKAGSDDSEYLRGCQIINLKESGAVQSESKSVTGLDLSVDAESEVRVFAVDSLNTVQPLMKSAYTPDTSVKSGATLYVAGDSTASVYSHSGVNNRYPQTGWAQVLQRYFDVSSVQVEDRALSGKSSLSFRSEPNYTYIRDHIKAGDYLLVQFGHNDSKSDDAARYTDPNGDRFTEGSYKNSLMHYIELAQDRGAYPILATSISRCKTSDAGLEAYVAATRELGAELNLPVVDLYRRTNGWIKQVGAEAAKDLFNYVKPKDSRFTGYKEFKNSQYYVNGQEDSTHINIYGADLIAQWATEELKRIGHPLSSKVNEYQAVPLPSYADAASGA